MRETSESKFKHLGNLPTLKLEISRTVTAPALQQRLCQRSAFVKKFGATSPPSPNLRRDKSSFAKPAARHAGGDHGGRRTFELSCNGKKMECYHRSSRRFFWGIQNGRFCHFETGNRQMEIMVHPRRDKQMSAKPTPSPRKDPSNSRIITARSNNITGKTSTAQKRSA